MPYENYCTVRLGTDDLSGNGMMSFEVKIQSEFTGKAGITQLVQADYSAGGMPLPGYNFSDYRLDGNTEFYYPDMSAVVDIGRGPEGLVPLLDGPLLFGLSPVRVRADFKDYIRFKPDPPPGMADEGIYVTLGIVGWNIWGEAYSDGGTWTLSADVHPDPTGPDTSNQFPLWYYNVSESGRR